MMHAPDCTNIRNYGIAGPCGCVIPEDVWARRNMGADSGTALLGGVGLVALASIGAARLAGASWPVAIGGTLAGGASIGFALHRYTKMEKRKREAILAASRSEALPNGFVPSHLGSADVSGMPAATPGQAPAPTSSTSEYLTPDAVEAVSTFLGIGDPQIRAARVEAEIRNLQKLIPTSVGPVRTYRLNQISKLQAELEVLRAQAAESAYSTELSRVVRVSAAAGSVLTAIAIFSGVFVLGFMAVNQVQRVRIQQAELQRLRGV